MASPLTVSVDWGDVATTTMENRSRKLADNVTNNNALYYRLSKRGRSMPFTGGDSIMQELRYAENQTFLWYSGFEEFNVSLNDTMSSARFPIKQSGIAVVISGLEQIQNAGREQMINLLTARVDTAEATFENRMSAGAYSDGTGFGGKQIGGTALIISKAPQTGVVGGIDSAANPWWQNYFVNSALDPRGPVSASNIQSYMNSTAINLKRNSDGVDLLVADNNFYLYYLSSLQAIQRITDGGGDKGIGAGFTSLKFFGAGKSVDVVLDGGKNGQIPPNTMYAINTDYFHFRPASERNYKVVGGDRTPVSQDAIIRFYAWAGNITVSNRSLQGVIY